MQTILIIEDDTDLRRMLVKLLERENYRVLEAGTGLEALQILDYYIPEMVITDIIMPDQDGIGTINELKKRFPEININEASIKKNEQNFKNFSTEILEQQKAIQELKKELEQKSSSLKQKEIQLENILNSKSFRLGRLILSPLRRLKKLIEKYLLIKK